MTEWQDYVGPAGAWGGHPIVGGSLRVLRDCYSPQLDNRRDILVHLPASYDWSARRYPVVYMHDGQNLFDPHTSFSGEWGVDDALTRLDDCDAEAIVVGIPNSGMRRLDEYSPFPDERLGGGDGDAYLAFITDTLKPIIDITFRTRPERDHTGIIGSSMGGLISLFALFERPEVFGFAGVMSPSLWFGDGAIFRYIEDSPYVRGRLALDVGTGEAPVMVRDAQRLRDLLSEKGYASGGALRYAEYEGAGHNEAAWGNRVCDVLRFLLADTATAPPIEFAAD